MSNIQKAFKNKAKMGLRMASGGFVSSIPDALPTSMFSGPGGGVGTTYSGVSSPLRQNQRMSGAGDSGGGLGLAAARPVGQERRDSPLHTMDNRIAQGAAVAGLSNTERYQLSNPGNQAYSATGVAPGSSAEASQMNRTNDIMRTLRGNLAQQPEMMADGGVVGLLRNRKAVIDNATGANEEPAPAPKPTAPAAPTGEAADYAAQAAAIEAEQLAAARKTTTPAPKKGLMSRLGFAKSGVVQGEGTRTSDSVPATVGEGTDKQKLALSDGEGLLVVSNNTMDNPQAMDQIRQILAASNGGKEPVMPDQGLRRGVQKAAGSAVFTPTDDALAAEKLASQSLAAQRGPIPTLVAPLKNEDPPVPTPPPTLRSPAPVERQAGRGPIGSEYANATNPQQLNARLDDSFTADADQTRNLRSGFISNMADDPNIKRGASRLDATQMRAPEGGGYVTGQPDANGLRRSIAVMPSEARWEDGQQYKDAVAQNEKDKVTLRGMQHDRIKRTAAMPGATQGDLVALLDQQKSDENEATAAKNLNDIAMRNAELGLRREEFGMINANRAADNERADAAARTASAEKVQGHMSKLLDRYVPTEGLKDDDLVAAQAKRSRIEQAMLANYGGQMPTDLATFEKNAATMLHQARLTEALNQAVKNRGVVDKVRNLASGNRRPTVSQDPMHPISEQDGLTIDYGGIPLFANDVFNGDADLISAYKQRVKDQAGAKTKKAASNK